MTTERRAMILEQLILDARFFVFACCVFVWYTLIIRITVLSYRRSGCFWDDNLLDPGLDDGVLGIRSIVSRIPFVEYFFLFSMRHRLTEKFLVYSY